MKHQPRTKSDIQITDSPFVLDDDNDVYVDTNHKHYNATIRRSKKGIYLKNTDHKSKPSVPTQKSNLEQLPQELLATINDKGNSRPTITKNTSTITTTTINNTTAISNSKCI